MPRHYDPTLDREPAVARNARPASEAKDHRFAENAPPLGPWRRPRTWRGWAALLFMYLSVAILAVLFFQVLYDLGEALTRAWHTYHGG